jgi:hypothetical protein
MPPLGLVQKLALFDKDLRIRWATHQKCWLIELKAKERQPGYLAEKPSAFGTTPRALDAWESWRQGYVFVTKLAHPITYPWEFIAAHLKHLSLEAHQAKDELLRRLEAAEAEDEAATKRAWDVVNEQGAKEIYDRLQWDNKRVISTHVAGDNPLRAEHDGFVTYDRRKVTA